MSVIEFKNHIEEFDRSCLLCDVIKVDGQLYVHISKVEVFQNQLQQKENIIKEVREYILQHCEIIRDEEKNTDMVGRVEGIPLLEILDRK